MWKKFGERRSQVAARPHASGAFRRARRSDERGAAMVEFAIVLPLLVMLTFGIIEFAVAFNSDSTVSASTRAGGRTAAILSTDPQMAFFAGQAAATALNINPNSIVGNAVVCVAEYESNNPNPCTEPTSTKMTLVHTGAPGAPVWQVADMNGANPGLFPATDNWPVNQRNYGCPTASQPNGSFDRVDRARADQAQAPRTRVVQSVLRQQHRADTVFIVGVSAGAGPEHDLPAGPVSDHRTPRVTAPSTRAADERGVVFVWLAIVLVVLLGVTALALDVGYWQLTHSREQRAADAAALAGAVTFPGDPARSNAAALKIANNNGYTVPGVTPVNAGATCPIAGVTTNVCVGEGAEPYQYKVTVAQKVHNLFGGIFGFGSTTVQATGTAEYLRPLSMGSPSNQFGNDPDAPTERDHVPELLGQHRRR